MTVRIQRRRERVPIKERIRAALASGPMTYYNLMLAVFPSDEFPRAWRYQSNGGPPGCAMAFGKALREMGIREGWVKKGRGMLRLPSELANAATKSR